MKVSHKYIYNYKDSNIYAFKQALMLKTFPGISACIFFRNNDIYINSNNINDECYEFNDILIDIYKKNKNFNGLEFYGVISGSEIIKQKFINDSFVYYVYACYNTIANKWLQYSEIRDILNRDFNYNIKVCPMIGFCSTNNYEFQKYLNNDIYSLIILPYPNIFVNSSGVLDVLEFPNYIYQENEIDYSLYPNYVYSEISTIIDNDIITYSFFRKILALYCLSIDKELSNLNINDLNYFKKYILNKISDKLVDINSERILNHQEIFLIMCNLKIRKLFIDFLIF